MYFETEIFSFTAKGFAFEEEKRLKFQTNSKWEGNYNLRMEEKFLRALVKASVLNTRKWFGKKKKKKQIKWLSSVLFDREV